MKKTLITFLAISLIVCIATIAGASERIRIVVNGNEIVPDVPPQVIDGRTMVPARYVAEALGADVKWDNETNSVLFSTNTSSNLSKNEILNLYDVVFYWTDKERFLVNSGSIVSLLQTTYSFHDKDYNGASELLQTTKKLYEATETHWSPRVKTINQSDTDVDKVETLIEEVILLHKRSIDSMENYFITGQINNLNDWAPSTRRIMELQTQLTNIIPYKTFEADQSLRNYLNSLP